MLSEIKILPDTSNTNTANSIRDFIIENENIPVVIVNILKSLSKQMCKTIGFVQNIKILLTDYNNNSLICTIYGKHLFDEIVYLLKC